MAKLTICLPDEKHECLRQLAVRGQLSVNKLIEEMATIPLAEFDAETRFRLALPADRGKRRCSC